MASNLVASGAEGSGDHRADDRADESAPRSGPKRGPIQRPGSGSPGGMYGPHVGSLEVMDLMAELAQTHPDARLHLDVMGADGVKRAARTYSVTSFDFDTVVNTYGAGEYRVRVQQLGEPRPVRMFRFIAASQSNPTPPIPPQSPPAAPAPQYPPPPPYYPQHVQGYGYPPPPQEGSQGMMGVLTQMMIESAKAQNAMVNTLLARLIDQKTTPQEPAKITELEAMIKLADKLSNRRSGRDGDDSSDELLSSIVAGLSKAIGSAPTQPTQQAVRPVRPKARPVAPTEHAGSAALSGVAPPAASLPEPQTSQPAAGDSATPAVQGRAATPPAEPPLDPITATIVASLRSNTDARRIAKLILVDDGDDAAAVAAMASTLMDDNQVEAFIAGEPGNWSRLFVLAFPALGKKSDLVAAVEAAMREELSDSAGDAEEDADAEKRTDSD